MADMTSRPPCSCPEDMYTKAVWHMPDCPLLQTTAAPTTPEPERKHCVTRAKVEHRPCKAPGKGTYAEVVGDYEVFETGFTREEAEKRRDELNARYNHCAFGASLTPLSERPETVSEDADVLIRSAELLEEEGFDEDAAHLLRIARRLRTPAEPEVVYIEHLCSSCPDCGEGPRARVGPALTEESETE